LQRDAIKQDGAEDDPPDGEQAERRAIEDGRGESIERHAVDATGDHDSGSETGERGRPRGFAKYAEEQKECKDGQRGHQGGEREAAGDGCVDLLPHGWFYPWMRRSFPRQRSSRRSPLTILPVPVFGSGASQNSMWRGILNLAMRV